MLKVKLRPKMRNLISRDEDESFKKGTKCFVRCIEMMMSRDGTIGRDGEKSLNLGLC